MHNSFRDHLNIMHFLSTIMHIHSTIGDPGIIHCMDKTKEREETSNMEVVVEEDLEVDEDY
jgi:hypothetical protein